MARPSLSLAIVGAAYPNKKGPTRLFELALCKPGEPMELRPEPKNPADARAIAVFSRRGVQVGYLTAERAPFIGGILKQGREVSVIFQRRTPWGGWLRAAFDGDVPKLPPDDGRLESALNDGEDAHDPSPDFYSDDIWPDE